MTPRDQAHDDQMRAASREVGLILENQVGGQADLAPVEYSPTQQTVLVALIKLRCRPCEHLQGNDAQVTYASLSHQRASCGDCAVDMAIQPAVLEANQCDCCLQTDQDTDGFAVQFGPILLTGYVCGECARLFGYVDPQPDEADEADE